MDYFERLALNIKIAKDERIIMLKEKQDRELKEWKERVARESEEERVRLLKEKEDEEKRNSPEWQEQVDRESEEERIRLNKEELVKNIDIDKNKFKELRNDLIFPEQSFIDFFGKPREQLYSEWVNYNISNEYELNVIKRRVFNEIVTEVNRDNLVKYYNSRWFTLYLLTKSLREPHLWRYFLDYKKFLFSTEGHLKIALPFMFFSKNERPKKVLEYGCGNNFTSLTLMLHDFEVTFADVPHKFFQFQKSVISKYFFSIKFIDLISDNALQEKYDYIICQEVLEHVLEPEKVLQHLIEHLNDGGIIWVSVFMDDMNGEDPSHLQRNTERYNNPDTWHAIVEKNGLKPLIYAINSGVIKGWYKPSNSRKYI